MHTISLSNGLEYTAQLQVWNNWQGKGYRLYWVNPGTSCGVQVDGEINGPVFATIKSAVAYGLRRFGETAVRVR